MTRNPALLFLLCAMVGLVSCVSRTVEPAYIPKVSTSRNYEGLTTVSWASRTGYRYRLAVRDKGRLIYDTKVYEGTGEDIVVQFRLDPRRPLPDYVATAEKTGGR